MNSRRRAIRVRTRNKMEKRVSCKRSQAWGMDLMVAVMIFALGVVFFFLYSINSQGSEKEEYEKMLYEGEIMGSSILSSGSPSDWSPGTVSGIGITDEGKINETKLDSFYNLASSDYEKTKDIFNTRYNYYFRLSESMVISGVDIEGIGKAPSGEEKNLARVTKFTVYKDKPVTAYIYVWE